ncbi:MAG: type II secretion system GspH family protein [Synergistaceae bacterium]|jgi:general secretion pathway protein G|nr:type II secretion system GspH family protein [Synergistaceae bacterium]
MKTKMVGRRGGFTLVELLIVIMIISILAGMMMLATGSATDSAEAAKLINDLRAAKSAALLLYIDEEAWPTSKDVAAAGTSLDKYTDRPLFSASGGSQAKYLLDIAQGVHTTGTTPKQRAFIGITKNDGGKANISPGVETKLRASANNAGLVFEDTMQKMGITGATLKKGFVYTFLN